MKAVRALLVVGLIFSVLVNGILWSKTRKRPIITVNGLPITQKDIDNTLERQAGQEVKAAMVQKMLVEQAATKAGVLPTKEEVDTAFNEQKELNWQVARAAQMQAYKVDQMKDQIRLQLMQQDLLFKDVAISDTDIKEEYDRRPSFYDVPDKARVSLAVVTKDGDVDEIKSLMEKSTQPSVIMSQKRGQVSFLGDNYVYTLVRPFKGHSANSADENIFNMKPGQVSVQNVPAELVKQGAKAFVIRLERVEPGKKADLSDPKLKKRIRNQLAAARAVPWKEYFNKLWSDMKFESEEPTDKKFIETILFPEKAQAEAGK